MIYRPHNALLVPLRTFLDTLTGAHPPTTFHWKQLGREHPPLTVPSSVPDLYYGPAAVYDMVGSAAHEAFIYNVAMGRLDVYTFDIWNLHQCQCAYPQKGLEKCEQGYYRCALRLPAY
jgi:hypothetical protein